MSPAKSEAGDGGAVAKAAGVVVAAGVAWSLYKSVGPLFMKPKRQPYHIVKGDTLFSIAQTHGVSVEVLKEANGIYGDDIYAGDTLSIPK
ncbi:hypothetical protein GOP47_0016877 [Adiantum capillus-veneris]|uniref:LysM domain-containing protein n=1 Tax=Adiantum capillus-veneris TaxID=13818 RepID=A0A9D4UJ70_ADICA|nr:hypothetical protein GOP47_0016877 [Adiantum capillus-veneris]